VLIRLAGSPNGYSVATLLTRGHAIDVLQRIARDGLATAHREGVANRQNEIVRVRISGSGRRALSE
jgi:hypothetical protein